jgi:regulatory protein
MVNVKISDIKLQKRNRSRYSVYVDGKYSFSLDESTLSRAGLYIDREVDEDEIATFVLKDEFYRARDYGYLLLSYRDRSEREFKKRLQDKGFHQEVAEEVFRFFKAEHLVDDRLFADRWVESVLGSRPMGEMRVRHELRGKLVEDGIIDEVIRTRFDSERERELARRAAEKKFRSLEGYPADMAKRRFVRHLQNRGFRFDVIHELAKEFYGEDIL